MTNSQYLREEMIQKPIIFFDLETTGVDIITSRIVQIGCVKTVFENANFKVLDQKNILINPTIPIPKEASDVHHITDEMIKDKPTFNQLAKGVSYFFNGCDIGGFNSDKFDIPLLAEEFLRAGVEHDFSQSTFIDVLSFERLLNPNNLGAVYQRYTGEVLENAHDALIDITATITVFENQLRRNSYDIDYSKDFLKQVSDLCANGKEVVDLAGKMYKKEGVVCWSFGKNINKPIKDDLGYCDWFLKSEFPKESKKVLEKLLNK